MLILQKKNIEEYHGTSINRLTIFKAGLLRLTVRDHWTKIGANIILGFILFNLDQIVAGIGIIT